MPAQARVQARVLVLVLVQAQAQARVLVQAQAQARVLVQAQVLAARLFCRRHSSVYRTSALVPALVPVVREVSSGYLGQN